MTIRYTVRASEDGYGVWDAAVHGWRTEQNLARADAQRRAAELTRRHEVSENAAANSGPVGQPADTRVIDPPRRVEIFADGAWWPGTLDRWARHPDGWHGRATRDAAPTPGWYPSGQLRPVN